jgi:hypothetical protein
MVLAVRAVWCPTTMLKIKPSSRAIKASASRWAVVRSSPLDRFGEGCFQVVSAVVQHCPARRAQQETPEPGELDYHRGIYAAGSLRHSGLRGRR